MGESKTGETFGRYRLLRQLGEGGMGVVYHAEVDDPNGVVRQCVIKRIRPSLAENPGFVEALVSEARLCAQLHHPGIVQLLELGVVGSEHYLAMQWLDGVDLRLVLKQCRSRGVPLGPGLACFIASEVASALAYAHSACDARGRPLKVIHRDVNPSNIFVTRSGRLTLLDFGIARATHYLTEQERTGTGVIKGTLSYMAPEQAMSQPLDERSDLFSLGVVLHECLTGQRLFGGTNPFEIMRQICQTDAAPPSSLRPELEPDIDAVVLKALSRSPSERYSCGEALVEALRPIISRHQADAVKLKEFIAEIVGSQSPQPAFSAGNDAKTWSSGESAGELATMPTAPPTSREAKNGHRTLHFLPPTRRGLRLLIAMTAMLTVLAAAAVVQRKKMSWLPARMNRQALAVLGFRNVTGQPKDAWLSTGLTEMLDTELRMSKKIRTLSAEEIAHMKAELDLREPETLSKASLSRIRNRLNADLVLLGSYTVAGNEPARQLRLDLRVQDCASGETISSVVELGDEASIFDLVASAGRKLREHLLSEGASHADVGSVRAALPGSLAAARDYGVGLAKLREGDALTARDLLTKAIAADDSHALSHLALAQAWVELGYDSRAQEEAKRAVALAGPLGREERLLIEAYQHKIDNDWPKAIETYQLLFDFDPDNIEYGLALADVQTRGARPQAALATLERISNAVSAERDDPRIELTRAEAYEGLENHQKAVDAATAARQKAQARGAELLKARADAQAAESYRYLGRCDKIAEIATSAKPILLRVNANQSLAMLDNALASCVRQRGDYAGLLQLSDEQVRTCEATGNRKCLAMALSNSSVTLSAQGHFDEAVRRDERAIAIFKEINAPTRQGLVLSNLAIIRDEQGRLAEGLRLVEEAIAIHRKANHRRFLGEALHTQAILFDSMGELERARRAIEECLDLTRAVGVKRLEADTLQLGARILIHKGELEAARRSLAEGERIYRQMGDPLEPLAEEITAATIDREQGKLASGEARVRAAIAGLEKLPHDDAITFVVSQGRQELADILAARRQPREAQAELEQALALSLPQQRAIVERNDLVLTAARVAAAQGRFDDAERLVARVSAEANEAKHPLLQLEARLAEVELVASLPARRAKASFRARASALRDDAAKLGFGLIASRASAALSNRSASAQWSPRGGQ
jgi:serine/threonine protein kinase/tetratricopeptide (TPR) repeat protein